MFRIQGTTGLYITSELKIINKGNNSYYKMLHNDEVEIEINGYTNILKLKNLLYIAKNKVFIKNDAIAKNLSSLKHIELFKRYKGKTIPDDIAVFITPIVIESRGVIYRVISTNTRYAISKTGTILDLLTYRVTILNPYMIDDKYPIVTLRDYNDNKTTRVVHRLMGFAWIDNDDWVNKTIVNHMDGNKRNFHKDNLEWCTYKHNNQHAASTDLKSDTKPIKIRNIETGEILDFPSITLAVEYMQRSRINIKHTNPVGTGKIITTPKGKFELKYKSDNTEWVSVGNPFMVVTNTQKLRFIIYKNNETFVCNNVADLKAFIAKHMDTKITFANDEFKNSINKFRNNYKELTTEIEYIHDNKDITYICRNAETKEEVKADSRKEAALITNGSKSTVQKSIITNGKYAINDVWYVKPDDGKPFPEPVVVHNKNIKVKVTLISGDPVIYNSLREASMFFGVDKTSLKWAIETKGYLNDLKVAYVE